MGTALLRIEMTPWDGDPGGKAVDAPLPDLPTDGPTYERTFWGVPTLFGLPMARREGHSSWSPWNNTALFWTDGQRTLAAAKRLALAETGKEGKPLEELFDRCLEAGLVVEVE